MLVSTIYGGDGRCDQCVRLGRTLHDTPEEHEELFRAASNLIAKNVTDEDVIIPTLVFAAHSRTRPLLRHIRDRFAEVEEGSEVWRDLENQFINSFDTLGPISVKAGALFLRARPLAVLAYGPGSPGGLVEYITIDVYARSLSSVDPEVVEEHYKQALARSGVSQSPYGLGLDEVWYPDRVRIMVSPPRPRIYAPSANFVGDRSGEQHAFPLPSRVRDHYATAVKYARENDLTDIVGRIRDRESPTRLTTSFQRA